MDVPQRKTNRLTDFDYNTPGAYFITICTQDRKHILSEIVGDGFPILKCAGRIAEHFIQKIPEKYPNVTVDKYVIMPDHIHLLMQIQIVGEAFRLPEKRDGGTVPYERNEGTGNPSPTVGNVIGWFKYQITKHVNSLLGTVGDRLFQRSYYDHVIRNQLDYDEIWEYIEGNPVKWLEGKRDDI